MGLRTLRAESTSRVGSTGSRLHLPFKEVAIFLSFFEDKSILPLQCVKNQERDPRQPDGDSSDNVLKKWIRAVSNLIAVISIHLDVSNVGKIFWSCILKDYTDPTS